MAKYSLVLVTVIALTLNNLEKIKMPHLENVPELPYQMGHW